MQLAHIKNLLTFAAFRPEPADPAASWGQRFANQKTLLLNVNRNTVTWQIMLKGSQTGESGVETGSFSDVLQVMADDWLNMTDEGWTSVSLNNRFILSLESNLSRKKGYEELLRTNPKAVLGSKYERGKTYAVQHHPETNSSLLLACEESQIKDTQEALKKAGLKTGRISCGLFAILTEVLYRLHQSANQDKEEDNEESTESGIPKDYLVIACCEGSVCILKQREGQWTELRSRSAFYEPGDLSALGQILQPMLNDWDPQAPMLFVNDNQDPNSLEQLKQMLPNYPINDVSIEDHLWSVIGKN